MKRNPAFALLLAAAATTPAWAQDSAAMQRCRALTADSAARLACYDAIPLAPAVAAAVAAPAAPTAAPAQAPAKSMFGFERKTAKVDEDVVDTEFKGLFEGWEPRSIIRLANGQSWQIDDGSNGAYAIQNPKIKIRRGMLGAFYLEIAGVNRSPRVRRLQ